MTPRQKKQWIRIRAEVVCEKGYEEKKGNLGARPRNIRQGRMATIHDVLQKGPTRLFAADFKQRIKISNGCTSGGD